MGKNRGSDTPSFDSIKMGLWGYDRESVLEFIHALLEQEKEERAVEQQALVQKSEQLKKEKELLEGRLKLYQQKEGIYKSQLANVVNQIMPLINEDTSTIIRLSASTEEDLLYENE